MSTRSISRSLRILWTVLIVILTTPTLVAAAPTEEPADVCRSTGPEPSAATLSRVTAFDASRVGQRPIDLPLIDETVATRLRELPPEESGALNSRVFVGSLDDDPTSLVVLTVHRDGRTLRGSVLGRRGEFRLTGHDGSLRVEQLADADGWKEMLAPDPAIDGGEGGVLSRLAKAVVSPGSQAVNEVDVMVLFTDRALALVGGTAQMQNNIDHQIVQTNIRYQTSSVDNLRLNLAFSAYVPYDEGDGDQSRVLRELYELEDGHLDEIHDWRDEYGADLVALVADVRAGRAFVDARPQFAFSVINPGPSDDYTFAHEAGGHNFGCNHDYLNATSSIGQETFNHGWTSCYPPYEDCLEECNGQHYCERICRRRWRTCSSPAEWGTILSYFSNRIPFYSNPDLIYGPDDTPLGSDRANNAAVLRSNAATVAVHRTPGRTPLTVSIDPSGGVFGQPVEVRLAIDDGDSDTDVSLYYTTDGSHPNLGSTWYDGPFVLDENSVVKAVAYSGSMPRSEVAIAEFEFYPISILPDELPDGVVGVSYSVTLSATGGTAPYAFSISDGALPAGLGLSPSGVLSGVPQADGTFAFTVSAEDSLGAIGEKDYLLTVLEPSPSGGRIAFSSNRDDGFSDIFVMDGDGTNVVRLTVSPYIDDLPDWSPEGSRIVFNSNRSNGTNLWVMDPDGSNQTMLTDNIRSDEAAEWSPDGTRIAFQSYRDQNFEIYVMNADGSNPVNLTQHGQTDLSPTWSPDGLRIAFRSTRSGDSEIWVMNADGSNPANLTQTPGFDHTPAWSPDGSKIAFSSERDGNFEIYVMNADGSNPQRLTNDPGTDYEPAWSADGSRIAFRSDRTGDNEVWVMNADGSNPVNLTQHPDIDAAPAWEP